MTETHRRIRTPWAGLAWVVSLILWMTWAPFVERTEAVSVAFIPSASLADPVINVLLLAPVGFVLGLAADRRRRGRDALAAGLVLAAVVALAEGGQTFVAGRHVSAFDALLNVVGGLGGFAAAFGLRRRGHDPGRMLMLTGSHLFFGVVVYMSAVGAQVDGGHALDGWEPEYGVRIGDEYEAPRSYRGRIDTAAICSGRGEETVCVSGGADREARARLASRATRTQHVRLAARVRSSSDAQEGPTRIITFSASEALRNATLGQSGRDLVLRLRTPLAGPNGSRVEFELPDAVRAGEPTEVRATYDRGRVTLASRTEARTLRRSFDYRRLTVARLVAWDVTGYRPLQLAATAAVVLVALFFPLGYAPALWLGGRTPLVLGAAVGGAIVAFGVMAQQLGIGWPWGWAGPALLTALIGAGGGRLDVGRAAELPPDAGARPPEAAPAGDRA